MDKVEDFFDINMVLMTVFSSLETIRDEKKIELAYEIDATIPKELKGNFVALLHLLTHTLTFVFQNSDKKEIVLSLSAPKDFLYEELISFEIKDVNLNREKLTRFLETELSKDIELLNGEIIHKGENFSDIHIAIPFKLNELGKRRYYRLPDMAMLDKKVLLICGSEKIAQSIKKMFKYFLYNVIVGADEYKKEGNNLAQYDILLIEDKLTTEKFENLIAKTQKNTSLKYVLLHDSHYEKIKNTPMASSHLIKPVMQESIFELIILLFGDKSIRGREDNTIIDMEKYLNKNYQEGYKNFVKSNLPMQEENKETKILVLDTEAGEQNAKRVGVVYSEKLKEFLDRFGPSDEYFIQEVDEKSTWRIKEFCIDLEKEAKTIGALCVLEFAKSISLLFVDKKLYTLPNYTEKYQIELKKLMIEIRNYLNKNYQERDKNPVKSNFPVEEENKETKILVLDTEAGEENAKRVGIVYSEKLKEFLDKFECSDEYFIQAVDEKSTWRIKEFCIDLEKEAKMISALRILEFAERISRLFVYNKLHTLPTHTNTYQIELKKLMIEIRNYLTSLER